MRLSSIFAAAIIASGAYAADLFYLGTWKIDSAAVAPWADPAYKPDAAESKTLVGKTVVIKATEIVGPRQVACKGPKYKVEDVPADGLFQGAFDEMHRRDKSADPLQLAAKVGFKGTSWKSLETGCAAELDFHFVDRNTFEFGLNDYVYIVRRQ